MVPIHWICRYCGIIINDSNSEPSWCSYCENSDFICLGYDYEYDAIQSRADYSIYFDPTKFTPKMQKMYWEDYSPEEKIAHQKEIDEMNQKVRQLREDLCLQPGQSISDLFK